MVNIINNLKEDFQTSNIYLYIGYMIFIIYTFCIIAFNVNFAMIHFTLGNVSIYISQLAFAILVVIIFPETYQYLKKTKNDYIRYIFILIICFVCWGAIKTLLSIPSNGLIPALRDFSISYAAFYIIIAYFLLNSKVKLHNYLTLCILGGIIGFMLSLINHNFSISFERNNGEFLILLLNIIGVGTLIAWIYKIIPSYCIVIPIISLYTIISAIGRAEWLGWIIPCTIFLFYILWSKNIFILKRIIFGISITGITVLILSSIIIPANKIIAITKSFAQINNVTTMPMDYVPKNSQPLSSEEKNKIIDIFQKKGLTNNEIVSILNIYNTIPFPDRQQYLHGYQASLNDSNKPTKPVYGLMLVNDRMAQSIAENNITWRLLAWKDAIAEVCATPVTFFTGIGMGHHTIFPSVEKRFGTGILMPIHNSYISIFYRTGMISFGIFALILILIFIRIKQQTKYGISPLLISLFAAWGCISVVIFFNPILEILPIGSFYWILLGLILRETQWSNNLNKTNNEA